MPSRKSKKVDISAPMNFEHRIHAGFDPKTGTYTGLPLVKFSWAIDLILIPLEYALGFLVLLFVLHSILKQGIRSFVHSSCSITEIDFD